MLKTVQIVNEMNMERVGLAFQRNIERNSRTQCKYQLLLYWNKFMQKESKAESWPFDPSWKHNLCFRIGQTENSCVFMIGDMFCLMTWIWIKVAIYPQLHTHTYICTCTLTHDTKNMQTHTHTHRLVRLQHNTYMSCQFLWWNKWHYFPVY